VKFAFSAASESITQEPVMRKVTTPPLIEHTEADDPRIEKVGVTPESEPVAVLIADAVGV
jgi:hypothetical protein